MSDVHNSNVNLSFGDGGDMSAFYSEVRFFSFSPILPAGTAGFTIILYCIADQFSSGQSEDIQR